MPGPLLEFWRLLDSACASLGSGLKGGAMVGLFITAALHPLAVRYNWSTFLLVFAGAAALLIYLWQNPLMLPSGIGLGFCRPKSLRESLPQYTREQMEVDAILEKVGASGMDSLDEKERTVLREASGRYQRRSESKKPESGLAI